MPRHRPRSNHYIDEDRLFREAVRQGHAFVEPPLEFDGAYRRQLSDEKDANPDWGPVISDGRRWSPEEIHAMDVRLRDRGILPVQGSMLAYR